MNILAWNRRGLGNPQTIKILRDMFITFSPIIVFLSYNNDGNNLIWRGNGVYGFPKYD